MTAITSASITPAPLQIPACQTRFEQNVACTDGFHQHPVAPPWQQNPGGPRLSAAIESHDADGSIPSLAISYSHDGLIDDGCVTLTLARGKELAYSLLMAIARAEAAGS